MSLRVLVIEDSPDDYALIVRRLNSHFQGELESLRVYTRSGLLKALAHKDGWDAVVCDYSLPDLSWPTALHMVRDWKRGVVFVVISGVIDDDGGQSAIRDGADDYLEKKRLKELGPLVEKWLRLKSANERYRQAVSELLGKLN